MLFVVSHGSSRAIHVSRLGPCTRGTLISHRRVSGPEKKKKKLTLLGVQGNLRGGPGTLPGNLWIALKIGKLLEKFPRSRWGSCWKVAGKFWEGQPEGVSRTSGEVCLPPSAAPKLSPNVRDRRLRVRPRKRA